MKQKKIIFHIDFDSYFASAHRVLNPSLDNKPIAIGKNKKRAICAAVSYELKNKGVKSGWPVFKIKEIEPKTKFIEPNFDLYISLSNKIFQFISDNYSKKIEVYSIDECWIDVSDECNIQNAFNFASKIQKAIKEKFRIPISIGIAHTKWVAKMSTGLGKPYGITQTKDNEIAKNLYHLPIEKYFGIGDPLGEKLHKINIHTIGDLAKKEINNVELINIFGKKCNEYIYNCLGLGTDQINSDHNDLKNIGNELTFLSWDLEDDEDILQVIKSLCNKVSMRAKNRNVVAYTLTLNLRSADRTWSTKQKKIQYATNEADKIFKEITKIFYQKWNGESVRGVGVRLGTLVNEFSILKPVSLFDDSYREDTLIERISKDLNDKLRSKKLYTADEYERNKTKENIQNRYLQEDIVWKG